MNDSFNYSLVEDEVCDKDDLVRVTSIAIPVFFSVVISLSLTGNILVLVILALYEKMKSITNVFILNLAISDLVFTAGLPFWAFYHIWGWLLPDILCKIVTFVFFIGFYSSILCLTIMTMYRYVVVVHPLSELSTKRRCTGLFLSVLMWMISIGAAMPSLLYSSVIQIPHRESYSYGCEYEDTLWEISRISQQNIFFLLAFAVMGFCHIQILRKITQRRSHTKNRAVKLIFCIVAVFFIGWVPYNLVILLKTLSDNMVEPFDSCKVSTQLDYAFHVCRLIAFSHCCLNPVFYAFVGVRFRSHLKSLLRHMYRRKSRVDEQQVGLQNLASQGSLC